MERALIKKTLGDILNETASKYSEKDALVIHLFLLLGSLNV